MKKILLLVIPVAAGIVFFTSCKDQTKTATGTEAKADFVVMPYKATYSSSFVISDNAKNEQSVLQSYKDWEDNKLSNAAGYYADTVSFTFPDGETFKMKRDSMINFFHKHRDSLSSSKIEVDAVTNLHSTDKNADWVSVWYKQTDTYKNGKIDSAYFQDDNNVVNGKIILFSSKMQKLIKK
ncbi:MAG TPA: hypothetical protein VGN20_27345 [Mucilaginibacter sp.]|jgi:hypothetical protein